MTLLYNLQSIHLKKLQSYLLTVDVNELQELKKELEYAYGNTDTILVSDQRYDILIDIIEEKTRTKQTTLIPIPIALDSNKKKLACWMGSLDKKKTTEEIQRWVQKHKGPFIITPKLDGISCLLEINNQKLSLYTRGDGSIGSDISHLQEYIKGLPKKRDENSLLRGELMITHSDFELFKNDFKNARQLVSGVVNSKQIRKDVACCIQFIGYEEIKAETDTLSNQLERIGNLFGCNVVSSIQTKELTFDDLTAIVVSWRSSLPYYIDGIVVTSSSLYKRNTSGNPDYAFAFKINSLDDMVETDVIDIVWNVSKRGLIKPTVRLQPVEVGGVTIQNATGFNAKFVTENFIGKGAIVQIIRSGDVIPHIVNVLKKGVVNLPNMDYKWNETKVDFLVKDQENDEMKKSTLTYFFKKIGVKSVSTQTIAHLYDEGLTSIMDILNASSSEYNMGDVISMKIHKNIKQAMKEVSLSCLVAASGLLGSGMGEKKIEVLLENISDLFNHNTSYSINDITKIKGFSDKSALIVIENLEKVKQFLKDMIPFRERVEREKVEKEKIEKEQIKVVFSGFRDSTLEKKCKENNIKVMSTISKNTDILIVRDETQTSVKIEKAKELKIKIMNINDFIIKNL